MIFSVKLFAELQFLLVLPPLSDAAFSDIELSSSCTVAVLLGVLDDLQLLFQVILLKERVGFEWFGLNQTLSLV